MQESFFKELPIDEQGNVILSVEECHSLINQALSRLGQLRVKGEITKVAPRGGSIYFDLKDAEGKDFAISCIIFQWQAQRFVHLLEAGLEVIVIGKPDLYKSGSFKLKIEEIKPSGEGAWKKEFEELKKISIKMESGSAIYTIKNTHSSDGGVDQPDLKGKYQWRIGDVDFGFVRPEAWYRIRMFSFDEGVVTADTSDDFLISSCKG